jgi:hypothetical protein
LTANVRCVAEYADAEAVNAAKKAAPEICMLPLFPSYRIAPKTLRAEKRVMDVAVSSGRAVEADGAK